MRRWRLGALPALLVLVAAAARISAADVVFRVPEVLVRHAAASKPVGTGSADLTDTHGEGGGEGGERGEGDQLHVQYEEYFVEHEVSTADARRAAQLLNLDTVGRRRAGCGTCSRGDVEYCEARALGDHCCCERRFLPEPLPWVPHTCYIGPQRCRPRAADCARYARLRDCCCLRRLAVRWKSILSRSGRLASVAALLLTSLLVSLARL